MEEEDVGPGGTQEPPELGVLGVLMGSVWGGTERGGKEFVLPQSS
jgi:hypothetical protein